MAIHMPSDAESNTARGSAIFHESMDNIVFSSGRAVALCGVDHLVVVETDDAVLVCSKDRVQKIKDLLPKLDPKLL
jgi:mannose-1-phosphate guanylyltransferase